eukprot:CAMPEP_0181268642 /NCGR_PEP_ID=MMETSP1097-20121128/5656_1 /TAXON_ID=35684 /ORGANISM="Pseudopedinella elastica, Strain CCMP716" /LENGTH=89 /DNA_ID=CAMNT_0023368377 /DNA_START=24 /DNA_END=289 /DNA_ORIENTATION=+
MKNHEARVCSSAPPLGSGGCSSNKFRDVHGHLVDLGRVELLNIAQDPDVVVFYKVDGHALAAEAPGAADAVDVQLAVVRQVVRDDKRDL